MNIPEHIKQKITQTMFMNGGNTVSEKSAYRLGAEFGYSLAEDEKEKEITELKQRIKNVIDIKDEYKDMYFNATKEIERLKGLIEKMV